MVLWAYTMVLPWCCLTNLGVPCKYNGIWKWRSLYNTASLYLDNYAALFPRVVIVRVKLWRPVQRIGTVMYSRHFALSDFIHLLCLFDPRSLPSSWFEGICTILWTSQYSSSTLWARIIPCSGNSEELHIIPRPRAWHCAFLITNSRYTIHADQPTLFSF